MRTTRVQYRAVPRTIKLGSQGSLLGNTFQRTRGCHASSSSINYGFRALALAQAPALARFRPEPVGAAPTEVSFGPFRLLPAQFLAGRRQGSVPWQSCSENPDC